MVDTHAHLTDKAFDADRSEVIARAKEAGVEKIICVLCEFDDRSINIFKELLKNEFIFGAAGVHPHDAKDYEKHKSALLEILKLEKIVGLGEIGLDYHYLYSPKEVQQKVFGSQIELAKEKGLPVIIHSREASDDAFSILNNNRPQKAVMHCFSGNEKEAKTYLDMGFYISFAGPVTFKNADKPKETLKLVPDQRLLLETDCPYLAPQIFRGKRNEPSYIDNTYNEAAILRNTTKENLEKLVEENAQRLFGLNIKKTEN